MQSRRWVGARAEADTESAPETSTERVAEKEQGVEKAKGVALDKEVSKVGSIATPFFVSGLGFF